MNTQFRTIYVLVGLYIAVLAVVAITVEVRGQASVTDPYPWPSSHWYNDVCENNGVTCDFTDVNGDGLDDVIVYTPAGR